MFTGIIEATAEVLAWDGSSLVLSRPASFDDIKIGSSICVQGVCLSVTKFDKNSLHFSVVPETIRRSTLGSFTKGQRVNLERGMKADSRLDGHIVQGHVEATAEAVEMENEKLLTFKVPSSLLPRIVPKGSIALDGVSLTVASMDSDRITVALIPHTLEQ